MAMKKIILYLSIAFMAACNSNEKPEAIEDKLNASMLEYLYKDKNYDTAHVKYNIEKVYYFEDKTRFKCEFKVHMKLSNGFDSTGSMGAYITKDYKNVERIY
jgi:hypothetical protein